MSVELVNSPLANDPNLISNYNFDNSNSNDRKDSNNGVDTGMTYNTTNGIVGFGAKAVFAFASNSRIVLGNPVNLRNLWHTGASISFWIYPTGSGSPADRVYDKDEDGLGHSIQNRDFSGSFFRIRFKVGFSTTAMVRDTGLVVPVNTWTFVVITYNASNTSNVPIIYLNAVPTSLSLGSNPVGTVNNDTGSRWAIGGVQDDGSRTMTGSLDDFGIWNRILSALEINQIYTAFLAGAILDDFV